MGKRTYSEEERTAALEAYLEVGAAQAARTLDIPARTIRHWAGAAGLAAAKREQIAAASEALSADVDERRAVIRDLFLEAAESHARASLTAKPRDAQALSTAAAIMLDKFRLEMGEATSRVESRDLNAADKARHKVDELAERRTKKTA